MRKKIKNCKEISIDEQKILQMDVLAAIDDFCKIKNIKYSMSNGTMLGAIRHKGYIPWDDDIDIYMLRDDYEKLMTLFPETYKDHYKIASLERSKKWDFPYAKAYDNRTIVLEKASYNELFGVNIDIFPIDDVPNDEKAWLEYDKERRRLYNQKLNLFTIFPFSLQPKKLAMWLYFGMYKLIFSRRKRAEIINKFSKKWKGKGYDYVFECCQGIFQKNRFRKEIFNHLKSYPFEDRTFWGFEDYDEYLRNGFGDYMKLPPIEKRKTHHSYKAYWIDNEL